MRVLSLTLIAAAAALCTAPASAAFAPPAGTSLSAAVNVDNTFTMYISSDDSTLGTPVLSGVGWTRPKSGPGC